MEHFNPKNLKASDLNFFTPKKEEDKTRTYRPFKSNITFEGLNEPERRTYQRPYNQGIVSLFKNRNSSAINMLSKEKSDSVKKLDSSNIKMRQNRSFYVSKYSSKNSIKDNKDNKNIKNNKDNNDNEKTRNKISTVETITSRNRKLRSVENIFTSTRKDENKPSTRTFIPRPDYKKKKNNSVTTLPIVNLTESTNFPSKTKTIFRNTNYERNKITNSYIFPAKTDANKDKIDLPEKKEGKKIPNFRKFERRVSDENLKYKGTTDAVGKNNSKLRIDEEKNKNNTLRKKSVAAKRNRENENNLINSEITTMSFIKSSEALSTAGRDDDGLKKINQDSYVLEKNINGVVNYNIFGVLDGHGVNGHFASQYVTRYIIDRIKNHSLLKNLDTPKDIYKKLTSNNFQILTNIYIDADTQIRKQKFNVEMSGTTAVLVIQLDEHIICANTGDSRAILVYSDSKELNNSKIFHLSYDAKPDNPLEKKRIYENGGVVEVILDEKDEPIGPARIWMKGQTYPGLAISRTIGDIDAKKIGVIPHPQIIEYTITSQTKYIILCSDGIWEFITNEEVMKIANPFYLKNDAYGLCKELTKISTERWLKDDVVVDDITVVVAFF